MLRVNSLTGFGKLAAPTFNPAFFDDFEMTDVGIWALQKRRTDYEGDAVRVGLAADSGATTLDIGFLPDGTFDWDTYDNFGTGSEVVTIWYDQSGNGFNLSRAWHATLCPTITLGAENNKPGLFFNGTGNLVNAGFTNWNGKADANFYSVAYHAGVPVGYDFVSGIEARGGYNGTSALPQWSVGEASSNHTSYAKAAHQIRRWQFDGGAATNILKARFFMDQFERVGNGGVSMAVLRDETGISVNASPGGNNANTGNLFEFYYFGYELTPAQDSTIRTGVTRTLFPFDGYNLFCLGDSLTYGLGATVPGSSNDIYPKVLDTALEAATGVDWRLKDVGGTSEIGAQTERVFELNVTAGNTVVFPDYYKVDNVAVLWCGTNDLAFADSAATAIAGNVSIINELNLRGFRVLVLNMLPRTDLDASFPVTVNNATFASERATFNSGLAAALSGIAELVDVAAIVALQDSTDPTYYTDGVHLTPAGYQLIADAVETAILPGL